MRNHKNAGYVAVNVASGRKAVRHMRGASRDLLAAGLTSQARKADRGARRIANLVEDYQGRARRAAKYGDA